MPDAKISLEELGDRFEKIASVANRATAIGVTNTKAAAYARALEYGSIAGQPPWPSPGERTVAAVNPETGARVIVSAQAPQGFIRVRAPEFLNQLREAIAGPANWMDARELEPHFAAALQSASAQGLEIMRAAAPRESGQLAQSLTIVTR